jgi:hypothetical protein
VLSQSMTINRSLKAMPHVACNALQAWSRVQPAVRIHPLQQMAFALATSLKQATRQQTSLVRHLAIPACDKAQQRLQCQAARSQGANLVLTLRYPLVMTDVMFSVRGPDRV